jgi:hypothetical protein
MPIPKVAIKSFLQTRTDFPDIFSWLLDEMGELPLPRKERGTAIPNPLKLIGVPS